MVASSKTEMKAIKVIYTIFKYLKIIISWRVHSKKKNPNQKKRSKSDVSVFYKLVCQEKPWQLKKLPKFNYVHKRLLSFCLFRLKKTQIFLYFPVSTPFL